MSAGESQIWTYNHERESYFDVPTKDELSDIWQKYHGPAEVLHLDDGFYGICEKPDQLPSAILSLDLCEVVRETGLSLARISGGNLESIRANEAGDNSDYAMEFNGWHTLENGQQMVKTTAQELMHHNHVSPVPYTEAIAAFMQRWRANGVYIIANTSTLPGCEASTIRFLSETYPHTTRGILLPRNHDGTGPVTKASILHHTLEKITDKTGYDFSETPMIKLEDTPHHARAFTETFDDSQVFMPAYTWNTAAEYDTNITRVEQQFGTLDTFIAADNYLASRGILK